MYTSCTHCHSACEVQADTLFEQRGMLRCAVCQREFDARANLTRTPPEAPAQTAAHHDDLFAGHITETPPDAQGSLDLGIEAPKPSTQALERTDIMVDVLTAHAAFIEPEEPPYTAGDADDGTVPVPDADTAADELDQPENVALLPSDVPDDAEAPAADEPETDDTAVDGFVDAPDHAMPEDATGGADDAPPSPDAEFDPVVLASAPSFIEAPEPPSRPDVPVTRRWFPWLAVFGLLLLLLTQSIVAERHTLAADARWRPWLERGCDVLGCTLPVWHEPSALRFMTRDIRPHPSVPDALLISTSFRNDAPWTQHWPRLHLTLSDLDGQPIAQREFAPDEYLGMAAHEAFIGPGQSASITLEVRDPGKQAVAFEFDLL